ncbi:prolipoprotein diacylglyceryl transferase [Indiicoccus explosivorum]|uniref:prolipoprotein diacylglyceryl transferase n=1 Tax=Indiicoccus explosivorum TaxID=1917864 RepID=UPI000B43EBA5|nr:prolipoprotein diacylglyceryl transferase [Indiicoccus explosivorum]
MHFTVAAIDPIAVSLGPIDVRWYGVIIVTGIILAFLLGQREIVRRGFDEDFLTDMLLWAVPLSILGARLYYVIFKWEYYSENPSQIFQIWEGGLAIHGAIIAAVIVAYLFTKKRNVPFLKVADILAPSLLLGQAIGRWGNFINQEAHGGEVSRAFLENLLLPDWIISQMYIEGAYYHPTFLYESLWNFLGVILLLLLRRVNLVRGEIFFSYLIWYSFGRFFIEGMRTDSLILELFGGLRAAQVISVFIILVAAALIAVRRLTIRKPAHYLD